MNRIGIIAHKMMTYCPPKRIEESMCACLEDMREAHLITNEDSQLFSAVIAGWQAVGWGDPLPSMIRLPGKECYETHFQDRRISDTWTTYLPVTYEQKVQWLTNLMVYR